MQNWWLVLEAGLVLVRRNSAASRSCEERGDAAAARKRRIAILTDTPTSLRKTFQWSFNFLDAHVNNVYI